MDNAFFRLWGVCCAASTCTCIRWEYEFSAALRETVQSARVAHGYTQDEVGEYVGKAGKSISNIERGIANPEFKTVYKLIRLLEIDANRVFYPEYSSESSTREQFDRLLAGCTDEELQMLLDISKEVLAHTRKHTELGAVALV